LRALLSILLLTALLTGSAVAKSRSPCDVVTKAELARVLGGRPTAPDPSTIGEETAPYCMWTTRSGARVKIEIWHGDELNVVGEKTARGYFISRRKEAMKFGGVRGVSIGEGAFRTRFGRDASGEIGVLKASHFYLFEFEHVPLGRALAFAKAIVRRT
jgi:hypothetical protein